MSSSLNQKKCSRCSTTKTADEFGLNSQTVDGRQAWCRQCFRDYNREWYPANKRRVLATKKVQYAKRKFGQ